MMFYFLELLRRCDGQPRYETKERPKPQASFFLWWMSVDVYSPTSIISQKTRAERRTNMEPEAAEGCCCSYSVLRPKPPNAKRAEAEKIAE